MKQMTNRVAFSPGHAVSYDLMTIQCPIVVTIQENTLLEDTGAKRIKAEKHPLFHSLISSYVTNKINS